MVFCECNDCVNIAFSPDVFEDSIGVMKLVIRSKRLKLKDFGICYVLNLLAHPEKVECNAPYLPRTTFQWKNIIITNDNGD